MSFDLETLDTHERFKALGAIMILPWSENERNLPHNQDLFSYSHLRGVTTWILPHRTNVDNIIIGLDNSYLMTVIEQRQVRLANPTQ